MKKTSFLWLLAIAAVLILAVLVIRPPAWATPIGATHLQPLSADTAETSIHASESSLQIIGSGSSHSTLQADTPSSDNCIACHTDKKKLKKLAEEPEEVKSEEASGEG